jgi:type IV pilus assembly protein PilV
MTNPPRTGSTDTRTQRGVTMLEVLVTLFIITLFLLASAGVQSSAVKLNKAAQFRTEAVLLATELGERIESNRQEAANGTYACSPNPCTLATSAPTATCVSASFCGSGALATFDKAEWGYRVWSTLPGATASIAWSTAVSPPVYTITLTWTDRRVATTYDTEGTTETFNYTMTKTVFVDPGG